MINSDEPIGIRVLRPTPVLALTLILIVPLPEPLAPEVIVTQGTTLDAVQLQEDAVVTVMEAPVIPPTGASNGLGFTSKVQDGAAAA